MKIVNVMSGYAPNGQKVWGIGYDSSLVKDHTCGTSVEKDYLDSILPPTSSDQEYFLQVAKYAAEMLEEKLIDKSIIYDIEFVCCRVSYKKTK